jgi:hypothetical protein
MLPNRPSTITTPEGSVAWYDRRSKIEHSQIALAWDLRQCTPTAPIDSRHCCPICFGVLLNAIETPCGHAFCIDCLFSAMKISPTCPLDRSPLPQPPGLPIAVSFPLNYPNDDPRTRRLREMWAFRTCGAFLEVKGPVKQALEELRARCPFRESEGCMVELPWDVWDLRTHITEMRHGELVHQRVSSYPEEHDKETPNTPPRRTIAAYIKDRIACFRRLLHLGMAPKPTTTTTTTAVPPPPQWPHPPPPHWPPPSQST